MNKILIPLAVIVAILIVARLFGWYGVYTVSTPSMEPNYEAEEYMLATNLKSPSRNDVVAYRSEELVRQIIAQHERRRSGVEPEVKSETIFLSRIIGIGGDKIELKDGQIYLNGKKNELNDFLLPYTIEKTSFNQLSPRVLPKGNMRVTPHRDSVRIFLSKNELEQLKDVVDVKRSRRIISSENIFGDENWNVANYGPIEIPENHFFLISDNRYVSMDSRVHGFVNENDIVSVILN